MKEDYSLKRKKRDLMLLVESEIKSKAEDTVEIIGREYLLITPESVEKAARHVAEWHFFAEEN